MLISFFVAACVALACVTVGWAVSYARLHKENQKLREGKAASGEPSRVLDSFHFGAIREAFSRRRKDLSDGILTLSIEDVANLWSGMFEDRNIVYFRATSKIASGVWDNPFMKRYSIAQRQNIHFLTHLDDGAKDKNVQAFRKAVGAQRLVRLGQSPFERTYMLTSTHLTNLRKLARLCATISDQSHYMDIRLCRAESIRDDYRLDFGFAVSISGDIWAYDLLILGETLHGGRFLIARDEVEKFIQYYVNIQDNSEPLKRNASFDEVVKAVARCTGRELNLSALKHINDQSESRTRNTCLGCFLESEETLKTGEWKTYDGEKRLWYQMLSHETSMIQDYVVRYKPQRIIEVGCGPGRLLEFLRAQIGPDSFKEVLGVECNAEMHRAAVSRFRKYMPPFRVMELEVRPDDNPLPYSEDHFDLCINAMNIVGWQEDEGAWLREMLRCSRSVIFSLYKRGHEAERIEMYKLRGHEISNDGVHIDADAQIVLGDASVMPCVTSRAYTRDEVDALCDSVMDVSDTMSIHIDDQTDDLLFLCMISKEDLQS